VAIFGNLFGQIFGDNAAEHEARGDYYAGVNNWRRATEEYRRALQRTSKNTIGYRRLAEKFDDARGKGFDSLVEEIHSHVDVREFTYASDLLVTARGQAETESQREKLDECERRLRAAGRSVPVTAAAVPPPAPSATAGRPVPPVPESAPRTPEPAARFDAPPPSPAERGNRSAPVVRPAASVAPEPRPAREPNGDQAFQKVLGHLPPAAVAARARLGSHYRDAVLAYARGEAGRAVELFKKSVDEHPGEPIVYYDLAAALAAAGRSREAQTIYLKLAERNPQDWQPYYEIAQLQWTDGLGERAVSTVEEGLLRHPRSGYLMAQWGVFLYKMGDKRGALERFYAALQLDSFDDAGLYHVIANLHLELGDTERARRGYLKALELNPQSAGTMLDYAEFLIEHRQDAKAALAILEATMRTLRATASPRLLHVYRSYLSSKAHMLLGEREMALLAVTRALEENDQAWLEDTLEAQRQAVLAV